MIPVRPDKICTLARRTIFFLFLTSLCASIQGQNFLLPTPNREILNNGGEQRYYVGTVGKSWTSGKFGCVRSEGHQMHEGIDIKAVRRDKRGEPVDPIFATAAGEVAYLNHSSALSNYGRYIILRHTAEGITFYSVYAHLSLIEPDLQIGSRVARGQQIGVMGRTANTRQGISKERAHLHFEINLFINERFPEWYKKTFPGLRNDHGHWNGRNLLALDPTEILLNSHKNTNFSLLTYLRGQTELCRVIVRDTRFPWLERYTPLVKRNSIAEKEGVAGYEIALNYNGVPFELVPRAKSELKQTERYYLLKVNPAEAGKNSCRKLLSKIKGEWQISSNGKNLLDLLTY
ncbi:MAG: M23 family metallopeptidase [Verrucomicrobiota bacterium]|nr:M23 family metallopeptidase [Verrucomicrobiota bacterium]